MSGNPNKLKLIFRTAKKEWKYKQAAVAYSYEFCYEEKKSATPCDPDCDVAHDAPEGTESV